MNCSSLNPFGNRFRPKLMRAERGVRPKRDARSKMRSTRGNIPVFGFWPSPATFPTFWKSSLEKHFVAIHRVATLDDQTEAMRP
jgi:hypothetical protein